jgi:phage-related protein
MMSFPDLPSASSDLLEPFTDQLRLAVDAYLAASRARPASTLPLTCTTRLGIATDAYTIECMTGLYEVEIEPEVRSWLASLPDRDFGRVDFLVGLLAEHAEDLGEPYTRHLGGKVRELRFHLLRQQSRVTYWLAPQRRVILLTVFRKTRSAETAEVARALRAQEMCERTHGTAHQLFDREVT